MSVRDYPAGTIADESKPFLFIIIRNYFNLLLLGEAIRALNPSFVVLNSGGGPADISDLPDPQTAFKEVFYE